ncbi:rCG22867 [Rattus norvegicus]|uniref:RCG22867 n=1 Tax=Rattus norvegicus TaxID=10116 RepID=A6KPA1_RAT|nr:rCG22867 [Rattus norvegicus]
MHLIPGTLSSAGCQDTVGYLEPLSLQDTRTPKAGTLSLALSEKKNLWRLVCVK